MPMFIPRRLILTSLSRVCGLQNFRPAGALLSQWKLCNKRMSTTTKPDQVLESRVAVVTGSTSGIGLGIARSLAARGCSVILNGFGDETFIQSLKEDFTRDFQRTPDYIFADFTKTSETELFCQKIKEIHPDGVDIIVNNAGFQHVSPVEDFASDKWDGLIAVMLSAPFHIIKHLLPDMKRRDWGRIINVSSVHGVRASPNKAAYVAAKHGIVGLTKVVALETATSGITCNAICPGYVNTPILQMQVKALSEKEGLSYEDAEAQFLSYFHPSKKSVGIDQLGEMAVFLCSDAASQITGVPLVADGGWTAK